MYSASGRQPLIWILHAIILMNLDLLKPANNTEVPGFMTLINSL